MSSTSSRAMFTLESKQLIICCCFLHKHSFHHHMRDLSVLAGSIAVTCNHYHLHVQSCSLRGSQPTNFPRCRKPGLEHMHGQVISTVPNRATWSAHCMSEHGSYLSLPFLIMTKQHSKHYEATSYIMRC